MEHPVVWNLFQLAKELRMTVGRLLDEMTPAEFVYWQQFNHIENEMMENSKSADDILANMKKGN